MPAFTVSDTLLQGWKVLIVDDETDSAEVVQVLLEMCGAEILIANNGQQGFEYALKHRPQFIVSDLSMPTMSGWKMLEKLKTNPATANIPVIAFTAHVQPTDRERAFSAGFHNYLAKPLEPETFVVELLNLLINVPAISEQLNPKIEGPSNGSQ